MVNAMTGKRIKDITGQQFGSLIAVELSHIGANRLAYWKYLCKCGNPHIARANTVSHQAKMKQDPELPSCGCVELARKTVHGFRKAKDTHPAYKAYRGMMNRCYNPNTPGYQWYGSLGVTVCDEWKGNPAAFVDWAIQHGWAPGLHIDKDILCKSLGIFPHVYSPKTCQWVTPKENVGFATNRDNYGKHPNVKLSHEEVATILGKYFMENTPQTELAEMFGVTPSTVNRLVRMAKGAA